MPGSAAKRLHVAITGAGGLIGSAITRRLRAENHSVIMLVRRQPGPGEISWDPATGRLDPSELEGLDAVVHLAGENIGARWTTARRVAIRNSRVQGTRVLSQALARTARHPAVLVSASAIGIYGNRGDEILSEESSPGDRHDFLVALGQDWEQSADAARAAGIRVVHPRFGVVLSPAGGALKRMLLPFRLGVGGPLGPGSQWMSWVSLDDLVDAVLHLILNQSMAGPVNVTAPEPVRNRDFSRALGRVLSRPAIIPVPSAALRLVFGEMADATLLASSRVVPRRLVAAGFSFRYPDLESALRHVLGTTP